MANETKTAGERMADAAVAQAADVKRMADAMEALAMTVGSLVKALAERPVAAAPAASGGGPTFPPYGRGKGKPVSGADMESLKFYEGGCLRTLANPAKARWHDKERDLLAAIQAEIKRQGGAVDHGDFGPAPTMGGASHANGGPTEDDIAFGFIEYRIDFP